MNPTKDVTAEIIVNKILKGILSDKNPKTGVPIILIIKLRVPISCNLLVSISTLTPIGLQQTRTKFKAR